MPRFRAIATSFSIDVPQRGDERRHCARPEEARDRRIFPLEGGLEAWIWCGYPVDVLPRSRSHSLSLLTHSGIYEESRRSGWLSPERLWSRGCAASPVCVEPAFGQRAQDIGSFSASDVALFLPFECKNNEQQTAARVGTRRRSPVVGVYGS